MTELAALLRALANNAPPLVGASQVSRRPKLTSTSAATNEAATLLSGRAAQLVCDTMLWFVRSRLATMPALPVWRGERASTSAASEFSLAPSPYATQVRRDATLCALL